MWIDQGKTEIAGIQATQAIYSLLHYYTILIQ